MTSLKLATLVTAAVLMLSACGGCEDTADPFETNSRANATVTDAGQSDTASTDASKTARDGETLDSDDPAGECEGASRGASCDTEGATCNYSCDGTCGFCSGLQCSAGEWSVIEDAPPRFCERTCHPVDAPCTDGAFSSCEYVDDLGDFRCFESGEQTPGDSCEPDVVFEYDADDLCSSDSTCVVSPDGRASCARTCDPDDQSAKNCPYGCKPASDYGIDDPDLGFCVVPIGQVCVQEPPAVEGECDIFAQDCPDGSFCDVVVLAGGELEFRTSCQPEDGEHELGEKEACDSAAGMDCAPGLKCREDTDTCEFLCRLSDGLGCTEGQSCSDTIGNGFGLGYCANSCE